jgi:hypothetical protein
VRVLAGPFAIAAVLVMIGGAAKAVRPRDTAHALTAVGVRLPRFLSVRMLVRLGGAFEVVVGVGALVTGAAVFAALVSVSYLAFTGFVVLALRSGKPISSCGCFGKIDTPPSPVHVILDVTFACVAIAAAIVGGVALPDVLGEQPLLGIPFLVLLAIGLYLVFLAFTALPKTMAVVREVAA